MAWKTSILVVANVTAVSAELLSALQERAQRSPTVFTLLVPARAAGARSHQAAHRQLQAALNQARARGLQIDGQVGDCDPILAVTDTFDPRRFDEIIVSTLPAGGSHWLRIDLPARVRRQVDVPVHHVVGSEPRAPVKTTPGPLPQRRGVLSPLTPLTWGRRPQPAPASAQRTRPPTPSTGSTDGASS
jgi:hypothetical protein